MIKVANPASISFTLEDSMSVMGWKPAQWTLMAQNYFYLSAEHTETMNGPPRQRFFLGPFASAESAIAAHRGVTKDQYEGYNYCLVRVEFYKNDTVIQNIYEAKVDRKWKLGDWEIQPDGLLGHVDMAESKRPDLRVIIAKRGDTDDVLRAFNRLLI
jgi:hypothetical protein